MYEQLPVKEEQRQAIEAAVADFYADPNKAPYRMAAKSLIDRWLANCVKTSEKAVADRDSLLHDVKGDEQFIYEILAPRLDHMVITILGEALGRQSFGELNEEDSYKMMSAFLFSTEMYRYCSARDNRVYGPTEAKCFIDSFIAQLETDFNPTLERFRAETNSSSLH